ncbi:zinc-dependent alcohol dehydrogenase family protein [Saccharopolyspora halophila]|uniref:Zinc-dependent alcohol dehydrogenase family protein n=1 Tax=Saccharopolyspora halophila TaxID=405551 RepID=A0ABN3GQF2_9PSEU
MKAAALIAPETIEIIDIPEPHCGPDEVLVRVTAVGLCGTDSAVVRGSRPVPNMPWVLGHEGVGEIVAVGSRTVDREVGQQVAIEPNYCCFTCEACGDGFTSGCPSRDAVGLTSPGLLAEYVAVPAIFTHPAADHVNICDLVCVEPLTVARAAVRRSGVRSGQRCLVVGTGSQGLFVCQSLLAEGITPHVREPHTGRRELALVLGAVPATDGEPFDHIFETSGATGALETALGTLVPGGKATLVGMNAGPLDISTHAVVSRQLSLSGSLIYDHPHDFADTIAALEKKSVEPHRVLQARYPLEAAAEAFAAVVDTPGKCWISLNDPAGQ